MEPKTFWQLLVKNGKIPALAIGASSLFIIYWIIFPDGSSANAIKWMLVGWAFIGVGVLINVFLIWKRNRR